MNTRINGVHSMSSNHLYDMKVHHSHERSSSSSHVSSVLEDIEDEEVVALRDKIKVSRAFLAISSNKTTIE